MEKKIKVAIVGCGDFARGVHLPNIATNSKYQLYAACDIVEERAKEVAEKYQMAYATDDYQKVLKDSQVDLVVITTRHDLHAQQTIQAAQAKKHILCEKPMALNLNDCYEVMRAVRDNGVKYTIGYNRALAPLVRKAKGILQDKNKPVVIYHRMANFIPPDHWLLDEKTGGGRVVGEGCHVLDLFCALTDSEPVRLYAEGGVFTQDKADAVADTQVVTLSFQNNSLATMLLSSVGNSGAPKESTEIFSDRTTIFIDDFKEMRVWDGDLPVQTVSLPSQDKGHALEIDLLADAILNDTPPPNGPENACRAALLSFKVLEAIKTHQVQAVEKAQYTIT
ncbi:MAG: Gfo/Idh/MocA family oxidoreductase [Nitrospirae bacterium]|nr:Gfo/Idh/MocA family oxidoreductase [Nitrospirota bacterium]